MTKKLKKKDCKFDEGSFADLPRKTNRLTMEQKATIGTVKRTSGGRGNLNDRVKRLKAQSDIVLPDGRRVAHECEMIVRHVNRRVKANFKVACMMHNTNMNAAILDFMMYFGNKAVDGEQRTKRCDSYYGRSMDGNGNYRKAFVPALRRSQLEQE